MRSFYMLFFAFLLLSDSLDFIPGIHYWDEAMIMAAPLWVCLTRSGRLSLSKRKIGYLFFLLGLVIWGVVCNITHPRIQSQSIAIFKDIIAFIKFPVVMIVLSTKGDSYAQNPERQKNFVNAAVQVSKGFIFVAFVGIFIGALTDLDFYISEKRFFQVYKFIFSHPTFLVSSMVIAITLLYIDGIKKNRKWIVLACVPLFMAQRFKGYAVIAFVALSLVIKEDYLKKLFIIRRKTKLNIKKIIPVATIAIIIVFAIFYDRFNTYLEWGMTSARIALYVTAIRVALDFFPFGSGFGTIGSFLSGEYYSSIYHMYNIDMVDGLRADAYNYAADTQWPWVYGQLGFIGAIGYVFLIIVLFKNQFKRLNDFNHIMGFLLIWFYIIFAGCMEAYLTNTSGIVAAIVLNVFLGVDRERRPVDKG